MKKILAIAICSLPIALMPAVYAQTTATPAQPGSSTTPGTSPGTPATPPAGGMSDTTPGMSNTTPSTPNASTNTSMADATSGWSVKDNIMGKTVYNENNEKVGDISDIILSADGKTTFFIVGVGGFIGMGERKVAIPFDRFTHAADKISIQGFTKDQLKEMPEFKLAK